MRGAVRRRIFFGRLEIELIYSMKTVNMNGKPAAGAFAYDAGFVYEHRKSPKAENESSFACKIGKEKMQFLLRYRQIITTGRAGGLH